MNRFAYRPPDGIHLLECDLTYTQRLPNRGQQINNQYKVHRRPTNKDSAMSTLDDNTQKLAWIARKLFVRLEMVLITSIRIASYNLSRFVLSSLAHLLSVVWAHISSRNLSN